MKVLQRISNNFIYSSLNYLLALLAITSMICCEGCDNKKTTLNNENLTISTIKKQYKGANDVQVELLIAHKNKSTNQPAVYNNLRLKITVTQEGGTGGSSIAYEAFNTLGAAIKKETILETEQLTQLFKVAGSDLIGPTEELKKTFTIVLKGNPTKVTVKYELLNASNNDELLDEHTIAWVPNASPTWQFELLGAEAVTHTQTIEDGTTNIKVILSKEDGAELTENELKEFNLYIKKTTIGTANLAGIEDGTLKLTDSATLTLAPDKRSASKSLTINPNTDKKAIFELQLQDKTGANLGTTQKVIWKNGASLKLDAHYDAITKKVTVTITNNGILDLGINQAILNWDTGHKHVTIKSNTTKNSRKGSQQLNKIDANGGFIKFDLDNVTFTHGKQSATLNLQLTWNQLEEPIQVTELVTAVPINVAVTNISFDKATNQIAYNIKNNGDKDISLQVQCINSKIASENAAIITTPLPIKLDLKKAGEIGSESGNQILKVDFKDEDRADFIFTLLNDGIPINFKYQSGLLEAEEVKEYIIICEPKQVKLDIQVDLGGFYMRGMTQKLHGDDKNVIFKIMPSGHANINDIVSLEEINKSRLKLIIDKSDTTAD
ncbi:MAG: hypothetical protein ACYC2U_06725, partial [Candidatus Amoebophilus sp.]